MSGMRRSLLLALLVATACAKPRPMVVTPPVVDVQPRLEAADALVRTGCFDCLVEALQAYNAIRVLANVPPAPAEAALIGSIRAALLLDLRERELGTAESGYLQRARDALASRDELQQRFAPRVEDVEITSWRYSRLDVGPTNLQWRRRFQELQKDSVAAGEEHRRAADSDILSAYEWVAFICTFGDRPSRERAALLAPLDHWRDTPIVAYRAAHCGVAQRDALTELLQREPRFREIHYWLGAAFVGARRLDEAEEYLTKAYEWRQDWPAVTAMLGNIYTTAEEFEPALKFYEETLALVPGEADAAVGRIRSLSMLNRHAEAFEAIDEVLNQPARPFPGELYYWRAWNGAQVGQLDQAWSDVEQASRLWVGADVAKLAGIIAYRRRELPVALKRFEEARRLNAGDCETQNYIGVIHAEQREWSEDAATFVETAACLDRAREALRKDIERISGSRAAADRKAHQIARREAQIESANRMTANAWFNIAAAYFNLGRREEARPFAEKLVDDERLADRARDLLGRLKP
jgi:tetratricopeptide (TPR) repeat protein